MGRYFTVNVYKVSVFIGVVVFLFALFLVETFSLALLIGAGAALLVGIVLPLVLFISDRRYRAYEQTIPDEIVYDANVNFQTSAGYLNGYLFLTERVIYLVTYDSHHDLKVSFARDEVKNASSEGRIYARLTLEGDRYFQLVLPNADELVDVLREYGYTA